MKSLIWVQRRSPRSKDYEVVRVQITANRIVRQTIISENLPDFNAAWRVREQVLQAEKRGLT